MASDASTNVVVALRIRPFSEAYVPELKDKECTRALVVDPTNRATVRVVSSAARGAASAGDSGVVTMSTPFTFDFVHDSSGPTSDPTHATQDTVFRELGTSIVENAWSGYNCTLFAYGQTGSGKTHSMIGKTGADEGMIPRVCREIFHRIGERRGAGDHTQYSVSVTFLEVYCERVRDLLAPVTNASMAVGLSVHETKDHGFEARGLKVQAVSSHDDVMKALQDGMRARAVAETKMNAASSRSHAVFAIMLSQRGSDGTLRTSRVNLVDLAGSERITRSGAIDNADRLREAANINQSLSTLGNVISALASPTKKRVVPYRESVLTMLLRESLGGNSKTLMIGAVSPASSSELETVSTLQFMQRAKKVRTVAVVNVQTVKEVEEKARLEIEKLKAELAKAQATGAVDRRVAQLEEQLDEARRRLEEQAKTYEERMAAAERLQEERAQAFKGMGVTPSDSGVTDQPQLISLLTDPMLSGGFVYALRENETLIGANPGALSSRAPDIELRGVDMRPDHCAIQRVRDDGSAEHFVLYRNGHGAVHVNGSEVDIGVPFELHQGDCVVLGRQHILRLHDPRLPTVPLDFDAVMNQFAVVRGNGTSAEKRAAMAAQMAEEAQRMCRHTKRAQKFTLESSGGDTGGVTFAFCVHNDATGAVSRWSLEEMQARLQAMRDGPYGHYLATGMVDEDVVEEDHPFYDGPTDELIGRAVVPLAWLCEGRSEPTPVPVLADGESTTTMALVVALGAAADSGASAVPLKQLVGSDALVTVELRSIDGVPAAKSFGVHCLVDYGTNAAPARTRRGTRVAPTAVGAAVHVDLQASNAQTISVTDELVEEWSSPDASVIVEVWGHAEPGVSALERARVSAQRLRGELSVMRRRVGHLEEQERERVEMEQRLEALQKAIAQQEHAAKVLADKKREQDERAAMAQSMVRRGEVQAAALAAQLQEAQQKYEDAMREKGEKARELQLSAAAQLEQMQREFAQLLQDERAERRRVEAEAAQKSAAVAEHEQRVRSAAEQLKREQSERAQALQALQELETDVAQRVARERELEQQLAAERAARAEAERAGKATEGDAARRDALERELEAKLAAERAERLRAESERATNAARISEMGVRVRELGDMLEAERAERKRIADAAEAELARVRQRADEADRRAAEQLREEQARREESERSAQRHAEELRRVQAAHGDLADQLARERAEQARAKDALRAAHDAAVRDLERRVAAADERLAKEREALERERAKVAEKERQADEARRAEAAREDERLARERERLAREEKEAAARAAREAAAAKAAEDIARRLVEMEGELARLRREAEKRSPPPETPPPPARPDPPPGVPPEPATPVRFASPFIDVTPTKRARTLDVCFVVDGTGSMRSWLAQARDKVAECMKAIRVQVAEMFGDDSEGCVVRFGAVVYRDFDVGDKSGVASVPFDTDANTVSEFFARQDAVGGGDGAEDVSAGLSAVLALPWSAYNRVLVHIADAPPHGKAYHDEKVSDNHAGDETAGGKRNPVASVVAELCKKRVDYYMLHCNSTTERAAQAFREVYRANAPTQGRRALFLDTRMSVSATAFLDMVVAASTASMTRNARVRAGAEGKAAAHAARFK